MAVLLKPEMLSTEVLVIDAAGTTQQLVTTWSAADPTTGAVIVATVSTAPFGTAAVWDQDFWDDVYTSAKAGLIAVLPGSTITAPNPIVV